MKNMIIMTALLLFLSSCDEQQTEQETSIYGTWQLIETGSSLDNLGGGSQSVNDGYIIEFIISNRFESLCSFDEKSLSIGSIVNVCANTNGGSTSGSFNIGNDVITLVFDETLDSFEDEILSTQRKFNYSFDNNYLVLINSNCDEGCYDKLEKISEPQIGE